MIFDDNDLPYVHDRRCFLLGSMVWLLGRDLTERILHACSGESCTRVSAANTFVIGLISRLRNAFHSCWTKPSLTCQCQMGDNYDWHVSSFLSVRRQIAIRYGK